MYFVIEEEAKEHGISMDDSIIIRNDCRNKKCNSDDED